MSLGRAGTVKTTLKLNKEFNKTKQEGNSPIEDFLPVFNLTSLLMPI